MTKKEIREQVGLVVAALRDVAGEEDPRKFAAPIVGDIPIDVLRWIAVEYLTEEVRHERRRETAKVEREATRASVMEEVLGNFEKRGTGPGGGRRSIPKEGSQERVYWETCTLEGRQWVREEQAANSKMWASLNDLITTYTDQLRTEWTTDLLESTFALTDGSLVTWGAATAGQHRERYDMFVRHVQANAEGAARHKEALNALERTGASCLTEALVMYPKVAAK